MSTIIANNRQRINRDLRDPDKRRFFSPASYGHFQAVLPVLLKYVHGKLIDIGCGDMPYRKYIEPKVSRYDSIDVERRVQEVDFVGDIHDMQPLQNAAYDSAVCFEVLEHVRQPFKALEEINRVLKPNGVLILSVPHLSRLHEEPHDYFRYTKYGLKSAMEGAGFDVVSITPQGGLFSFLGHQLSTMVLCPVWHVPVLKGLVFFLNKWCCVKLCHWLDRIFDKKKLFALGYVVVAIKKPDSGIS